MRRRDKSKQTGVLKANGSLMNKIFKVYMLLMFVSCVVLLVVFGIRFSSVYNSQARSHMNDVTVAAETGLEGRISQIDSSMNRKIRLLLSDDQSFYITGLYKNKGEK